MYSDKFVGFSLVNNIDFVIAVINEICFWTISHMWKMCASHCPSLHPLITPGCLQLLPTNLSLIFISTHFVLWSTEINQCCLSDHQFGAICWSLVGSNTEHTLKMWFSLLQYLLRVNDSEVNGCPLSLPIWTYCW